MVLNEGQIRSQWYQNVEFDCDYHEAKLKRNQLITCSLIAQFSLLILQYFNFLTLEPYAKVKAIETASKGLALQIKETLAQAKDKPKVMPSKRLLLSCPVIMRLASCRLITGAVSLLCSCLCVCCYCILLNASVLFPL